jgi:hypothetical protein
VIHLVEAITLRSSSSCALCRVGFDIEHQLRIFTYVALEHGLVAVWAVEVD